MNKLAVPIHTGYEVGDYFMTVDVYATRIDNGRRMHVGSVQARTAPEAWRKAVELMKEKAIFVISSAEIVTRTTSHYEA